MCDFLADLKEKHQWLLSYTIEIKLNNNMNKKYANGWMLYTLEDV